MLIGAVDTDFSRKVMIYYLKSSEDQIYNDAGIEDIYLPKDGAKSEGKLTEEERMDHLESGYSG